MASQEQVQINLDNDTANFRAQHSALGLKQISRPKNTHRAYMGKIKEWSVKFPAHLEINLLIQQQEFCSDFRYDDGETVHEAKVVRFFQERVINRALKNQKSATSDIDDEADTQGPTKTLDYNSVRLYKTALIDLYHSQTARGLHHHPHPNGSALHALMNDLSRKQDSKKKETFEDRGRGTIADGYDARGLRNILDQFWKLSHATKSVQVAGNLRGRLDFILSHLLLARGEARRFAELPDLQLLMLDNEGPSPCPALLYIMSNGKTNQNGGIEYTGLLRNKDVSICGMNALAFYFFWRWEHSGEPFPCFKSNKNWYNTKVLVGKLLNFFLKAYANFFSASPQNVCKEMSDSTQRKWILDVYKNLGLTFSKVTHAGRGSGSRIAEGLNIEEDQIRRAGNWNTDSMHKGYLTHLPRKFMRGMAGFDPNHPGTYHIARSTVQPSEKLLFSFWQPLNEWANFSFQDIGTSQFVKLLLYLRIVFLQDSAIFRSRFPSHPLFTHILFSMPEYEIFAADVLANLDERETDQNILVRQALPHLGQQIVDTNTTMAAGFQKTCDLFNQLKEEFGEFRNELNDFTSGKVSEK